ELARETDRELADVDHLLHFAQALAPDLSHLRRDELAERLLVLAKQLAETSHERPALRRRHHAERGERVLGALHQRVVVGAIGARHLAERLARRGARAG